MQRRRGSWPPEEKNSIRGQRLDLSELLCNKVLLKCKGNRESFWHRHQKGVERVPPLHCFLLCIVFNLETWSCLPLRLGFQASARVVVCFRKSPVKARASCAAGCPCACTLDPHRHLRPFPQLHLESTVVLPRLFTSSPGCTPCDILPLISFMPVTLLICPSLSHTLSGSDVIPSAASLITHVSLSFHLCWGSSEPGALLGSSLSSLVNVGKLVNLFRSHSLCW